MATPFRLTPLACSDLEQIWDFIARDDASAADRVQDAILEACLLLSQRPHIGTRRPRARLKRVLFWTVPAFPNYQVIYDPDDSPIRIVAVLHGKRNLRRILRERP